MLHPLLLFCAVSTEAAKIVFDAGRQVGCFLWHHELDDLWHHEVDEASRSDSTPAHA
jgi:hypothetical protein